MQKAWVTICMCAEGGRRPCLASLPAPTGGFLSIEYTLLGVFYLSTGSLPVPTTKALGAVRGLPTKTFRYSSQFRCNRECSTRQLSANKMCVA